MAATLRNLGVLRSNRPKHEEGALVIRVIVRVLSTMLAATAARATCDDPAKPCPDSSSVSVTFAQVFTGTYRTGEPRDILTIVPGTGLETLASNGITINVRLLNHLGEPLAGVAEQDILLGKSSIGFCICQGGNEADAPTDTDGMTTFTGALRGGGVADSLVVRALGVDLGYVPVRINSPDHTPVSPCSVDAGDISFFANYLGSSRYSICCDFNEDGAIDASDLSYLATSRQQSCTRSL